VAFSWSSADGRRQTWAQALRLRDGRIIDMQDYANPQSAIALMHLRTVFS
jgi:ketosteroid isomerase-like protein